MVSKCIGYFPEYREVTGTPRGINGPQWALVEKIEGRPEVAPLPPKGLQIGLGEGGAAPLSLSLPTSFPLLVGVLLLLGGGLLLLGAP